MSEKAKLILQLREQGLTYRQIKEHTQASLATISFHCSEGQKGKNAARTRDRRNKVRKYLQEYKASKVCADCGEKYPYFVLEFDHVRGTKVNDVSQMVNNTLEVVMAEIAKCEVVCANCHKYRTWSRLVKSGSDVLDFDPDL